MFTQSKSYARSFGLNSNEMTKFEYDTEIPKSYPPKFSFSKREKTPFSNKWRLG